MRKLFFIVLGFISLQAAAQAPVVTKTEVNTLINAKLTNYVKPSDYKVVARKLSDFANQGDSIARTKEPFIVPGSSGAYLNGLKQWVAFPDLSIYSQNGHTHAWSAITGKPTIVATSGITDAVSTTGVQTLTNKIIVGANNSITLTSTQVTNPLGYIPVNPASTPSLVPLSNDVQNVGGSLNYFSNGYVRQLNLNSTAAINGATNGKVSITGILKGNGAELTGIPYEAISNPPSIPADNTLVHLAGTETITGAKNFTTNPTYNGSQLVNVSGSQTITSKVLSGANNTFSNIPYSALTGTPTIPTNADYVDRSTTQSVVGSKTFSTTINFTDLWSSYQSIFGSTNQGARVGFRSGLGSVSGVLGYESLNSDEFQVRAGSQSSFTNSGNRTMTLFPDGNVLVQTGGTAANSGYKFQVQGGETRLDNMTHSGLVKPNGDNTVSLGLPGSRYANIYSVSVNTNGVQANNTNGLALRSSDGTQGLQLVNSNRNVILQNGGTFTDNLAGLQVNHTINAIANLGRGMTVTPTLNATANNDVLVGLDINPTVSAGAFTGVIPYALRVGSAMKLDGALDFGGHLIPQSTSIYNIGSTSRYVSNMYSNSVISRSYMNSSGVSGTTYGQSSTALGIDIQHGSATQLVAGWHPSGNMFIQPRGVRPADSGDGLQIWSSAVVKGELRNEIGLGGFRTSDILGPTVGAISFHDFYGPVAPGNFFLGHTPGPSGQTYLNGTAGISLLLGVLPRLNITEGLTEITEGLKVNTMPEYADNTAAQAAGLPLGRFYRTGDVVKVVH